MTSSAATRIKKLRTEIRRLDHLYYVAAAPAVSDLEYDRLMSELKQLEEDNPELRSLDSPTQRIGDAPVPHLIQVAHSVPMLSIDNTYSRDELKAYFERTEKLLDGETIQWVMEFKIDGVAASVRYEQGVMTQALTRGNGNVGDDITHNIRTVRDLPLRTIGDDPPPVLEVRGEVYMTNEDLAESEPATGRTGIGAVQEHAQRDRRNDSAARFCNRGPKETSLLLSRGRPDGRVEGDQSYGFPKGGRRIGNSADA